MSPVSLRPLAATSARRSFLKEDVTSGSPEDMNRRLGPYTDGVEGRSAREHQDERLAITSVIGGDSAHAFENDIEKFVLRAEPNEPNPFETWVDHNFKMILAAGESERQTVVLPGIFRISQFWFAFEKSNEVVPRWKVDHPAQYVVAGRELA